MPVRPLAESDASRRSLCQRAQLFVVDAIHFWTRAILASGQRVFFRRVHKGLRDDEIHSIVVHRTCNIGDAVVSIPALTALRRRFPRAHITLLTSPGLRGAADAAAALLDRCAVYDERVTYYHDESRHWSGRRSLVRDFRARRIDLYVELAPGLVSMRAQVKQLVFARLIGATYAIGFQVDTVYIFGRTQALYRRQPPEVDRLVALLAPVGVPWGSESASLVVDEADRRRADQWLARHGIPPGEPVVAIHAGTKRPSGQWPEDRFADVVRELTTRWPCRILLVGARGDVPLADRLAAAAPGRALVAAGETDVSTLAALLSRCTLLVSNDSGPMHVAAAVGTPVVAIFSGKDFPGRWYPQGDQHVILQHDVPCSPCFLNDCPKDLLCLRGIEPRDVIQAIEERGFFRQSA